MESVEVEKFDEEILDDLDSYRQLHERSIWRRFETELQEDVSEDEAFDELRPWEVAFELGEEEANNERLSLGEGF